ncbi:MAG: YaaR family protein [Clostridiales bacterium]|nr:YaaR family protein [Clostridiales bacterium]
MMRVQKADRRPEGHRAGGARDINSPISHAQGKSFDNFLNDSQYKSMKEKLAFLMEDIKKQGKKLADRVTLEDLLVYKKMIAQFLDMSVGKMLELRKDDYLDRAGRHHIYALVRKVDRNIEALTKEVLSSQKDQLTILSYIDDIRGLLMDMLL